MEKEAYLRRKIASRKKLCKLLQGYKEYHFEKHWGLSHSLETSRLIDCIDQVDATLKEEISWAKKQIAVLPW